MAHPFAVVAFASPASLAIVSATEPDPAAEAIAASHEWLGMVDAGQYGQSWDEAAALFKQHISKSQWERAVGEVRKQTGALKTRKLESAQPAHQLPGVPDGDYVSSSIARRLLRPRLQPKQSRRCAMRMATGALRPIASGENAPEDGWNDTFGHPVGDKVLIQLSRSVPNLIRATDSWPAGATRNSSH